MSSKPQARLANGLEAIRNAPLDTLRDLQYLTDLLRGIGMVDDLAQPYSIADKQHVNFNSEEGLWQRPVEFAPFLILASTYRIQRALEIGTFYGYTAAVMCAYLSRFNPDLEFISVDINDFGNVLSSEAVRSLPIRFHLGTSADFRGNEFDLCFVDGDHYNVEGDYYAVGRQASFCAFHDIDHHLFEAPQASTGFWRRVVNEESQCTFHTFICQPREPRQLGIGVRIKNSCRPWHQSSLEASQVHRSGSDTLSAVVTPEREVAL